MEICTECNTVITDKTEGIKYHFDSRICLIRKQEECERLVEALERHGRELEALLGLLEGKHYRAAISMLQDLLEMGE